ncbi:MAG: polysaccharide deacetylase family protein [Acidobacteria bacterium]|nr:polysaccharide deacetylase family protein [Acidobacteriota bacterium]
MTRRLNALMYHDVVATGAEDSSGFPGRDAALYKVTPQQFALHLDAIERAVGDRPDPRGRRSQGAPAITFDDGGVSALTAAELLEARGWIGHFFITANYIGTRGFVSEDDLRELARRGHVIGSHSCSHPLRMGHCSWAQLVDEWTRSCDVLRQILGADVHVASVPGGDFAPQVAEAAAKAGITTLFTSEPARDSRQAFGLTMRGRFTIQKWTTAATAAALAAGEWLPCARQAALWNAKKLTKRLGGERYLQLRKLLLRHGSEVRWGDQHQS